jgi:hypothetical protein
MDSGGRGRVVISTADYSAQTDESFVRLGPYFVLRKKTPLRTAALICYSSPPASTGAEKLSVIK